MICLIAGLGQLPLSCIREYARQNIAIAHLPLFREINGSELEEAHFPLPVRTLIPEKFSISSIKETLTRAGVTKVHFAGKVDKQALIKKISYDWDFLRLSARAVTRSDADLMELIIEELATIGITVVKQAEKKSGLFVTPGILTGSLTPQQQKESLYGLQIAEEVARLGIGQTVALKDMMVIAVEAIEGTDACIARALALGTEEITLCKTTHSAHNTAYDIPTLGPETLRALPAGGLVKVIAWHADRTLILEPELCIALAAEKQITLYAV